LAAQAEKEVHLGVMGDVGRIRGDALRARRDFEQLGGQVESAQAVLGAECDLYVDALLGTGLERTVAGDWAALINALNQSSRPLLSIDIPSGLHADSGRVLGTAVSADATVTFIGLKQGMLTGVGPDVCGQLLFDDLDLDREVYGRVAPSSRRIDFRLTWPEGLRRRRASAHKGRFGHLLLVGGSPGMAGAIRMAGEAALRVGAGLVTIATDPAHATIVGQGRPELMCRGVAEADELAPLLAKANVLAVGPGLGRSDWAQAVWRASIESGKPLVIDADGLNLLADQGLRSDDWILTPHPGEAARLLGSNVNEVQKDRFAAASSVQRRYGGTCVLKGAGTLIAAAEGHLLLSTSGNPGMAAGGMGDVLTGVIGGLLAQGLSPLEAASFGVWIHGCAGDFAAASNERGLMAADLFPHLRNLANPNCA
jgi:NAD(P)H-hydrate epimerase